MSICQLLDNSFAISVLFIGLLVQTPACPPGSAVRQPDVILAGTGTYSGRYLSVLAGTSFPVQAKVTAFLIYYV